VSWNTDRQVTVDELQAVARFIDRLNNAASECSLTLSSHCDMFLEAPDGRTVGWVGQNQDGSYVYLRETAS
jgi:hypothetical protein